MWSIFKKRTEKKHHEQNESLKQKICENLDEISSLSTGKPDLLSKIRTYSRNLGDMIVNSSEEQGKTFSDILDRINDMKQELRVGNYSTAEIKFGYVLDIPLDTSSRKVKDLYSDRELLTIMLTKTRDQITKKESVLKDLHDQIIQNPNNAALGYRWNALEAEYNTALDYEAMLGEELTRNTVSQNMKVLLDKHKELITKRTINDDEFQVIMTDYEAMKQERAQTTQIIKTGQNILRQNTGYATSTNANLNPAFSSPFFQTMSGITPQVQTPSAQAQSSTPNMTNATCPQVAASTLFNKFNNNNQTSSYSGNNLNLKDIDNILSDLENTNYEYQALLQDKNNEQRQISSKLKMLLEQRKNKSEIERKAADAEIDSLQAKLYSIIRAMEEIRQAQSIITDKITMAERLQNRHDINTINELAKKFDMHFANPEQVAMFLREEVEKTNADINRWSDAVQVADGVTPEINPAASMLYQRDGTLANSDDKYADLEQLIGLKA